MALKREQTGALLELYFEAEERIIEDMARRIAAYDYFIPAAQHQMKSLEQMGKCRADIYRQLSELAGRSENELAAMLRQTVADNLAIDREIYKANKLDADAAMGSAGVAKELKAGFEQTNGTLKNITGTTARLGAVQFQNELDNAWMMVSSGAFSSDEAVRQAVNRLADSGVKAVKYDSGRTLSLEAAVGMCVATGAAQTAAKSRIALAGEVGCDLVEVTAHAGARPEHAEWQGSICSLSGKSRKYPSLREHTGYGTVTGLCGANCAHSFFPWFEGSSRNWTEDELARLNEPKYEYNGKKLTEYEANQVQRGIERNIRAYKRRVVGLEAAGQDSAAAATKVREWQSRQREFLAATGLKRKSAREQVALTNGAISGTMGRTLADGGVDVRTVGHIDIKKYRCIAKDITTDEVIITPERVQHIKDRHPGDYEKIESYMEYALNEPDYILKDEKNDNTGIVLKLVDDGENRFQIVLRVHTSADVAGFKNSIISAWNISETRWRNYVNNKKVLYKRE